MRCALVILLVSIGFNAISQQVSPNTARVDVVADRLLPSGDEDLNYEDLYETLSQFVANPVNINTATAESLSLLSVLSQDQINSIIDYRKTNGDLLEIYELQSVPLLDAETIYNILPFVKVAGSYPSKDLIGRIRTTQNSYFFTRYERTLETARAYNDTGQSGYAGDQGRIYSRFKMTSAGDLSLGFTAEKDAGEQMLWTKEHRGFDFYSGHLQLINKGPFLNAIAGDYTAQFGQGLTLGGGFGMGKGSETITTLRRTSTGFMPYSSANESGYFRGGAVSLGLPGQLFLHTFYSSLSRDVSGASFGNDSVQSEDLSLAVLQSGKHRTANELNGRHHLSERNFGAVIELKRRLFEAGLIAHRTLYGIPVSKSKTVYNTFDFSGTMNTNVGVFTNYTLQNFSFFGEASHTVGHGSGLIAGVLGSITRTIDVSLLFRRFDRDYYSFYSNAISENTTPKNERGIYWGWKHAISRKLFYTAYADLFSFPWLKFRNYMPSTGSESLVRLTYRLSKTIEFYAQFRDERKTRNYTSESPTYQAALARKQNWTINSSFTIGKLSLRTRVQYSSYHQTRTTNGFAIAMDVGYDWNRVSISSRFAVFDTDDFDNRQYMNERDVLMAFAFPAYYGEGSRSYLVCRYQPVKWLDFWMKAARTNYFNATSSGSSGDTIAGSKRHDIKLEVVVRF